MSQKVFHHREAVAEPIDKNTVYIVKTNDEPVSDDHKIPIMVGGYYGKHNTNGEYIVVESESSAGGETSRVWGSGNFTNLESCHSVDDVMTKPIRVEYKLPVDAVLFGNGRYYMLKSDYNDPKLLATIPVWAMNEVTNDGKLFEEAAKHFTSWPKLEALPHSIAKIKVIAERIWAQFGDMYKSAKVFQSRDFPETSESRSVLVGFDGFEGYSVGASQDRYEGRKIEKYAPATKEAVRVLSKWLDMPNEELYQLFFVVSGSHKFYYPKGQLVTMYDNLIETIMGRAIGGVDISLVRRLHPCIMHIPNKLVYSKSTPQRKGLESVPIQYKQNITKFLGKLDDVVTKMTERFSYHEFKLTGSILEYAMCEDPSVYDEQFKDSDIDCLFNGHPDRYDKIYQYFLETYKNTDVRVQKIVSSKTGYYKFKVTVPGGRTLEIYPSTTRSIIGYHSPTSRGYIELGYGYKHSSGLGLIGSRFSGLHLTPSAETAYATGIITHLRWILVGKNSIDVVLKRIRRGFKFMASPVEAEKLRASMGDDYAECDFPKELEKYVAVDSNGHIKHYSQFAKV